jgi:hypothetical protein
MSSRAVPSDRVPANGVAVGVAGGVAAAAFEDVALMVAMLLWHRGRRAPQTPEHDAEESWMDAEFRPAAAV